jgi:LmbE family N-acetylglucosaminyl deacetylase
MSVMAASTLAAGQDNDPARTVLAILSHPDDELFVAPALAAEARLGSRVVIVYATSGDAGPGVSDLEKGEELGAVREAEARCAARALDAQAVFLRFGDGQLARAAGQVEGTAPRLRSSIRDLIAQYAPQTVMTWGPGGGYGHVDHRMVSALTTEAVQTISTADRPQLLYSAIAAGRMPKGSPLRNWAETDPSLLTVTYEYTDEDLSRARAAAQCHVTQFEASTLETLLPFFDETVWKGEVPFREAF